jgi:hypothetical protein
MEKHPITSTVIITIVAAFLSQFGSLGLDAMSNFITNKKWCTAGNDGCLFIFQLVVLIGIILIAILGDSLILQYSNWTRVSFSVWNPLGIGVLGGIVLHNNSWVDLDDCIAELIRYEEREYKKVRVFNWSDFFRERGGLPKKLFWMVDEEFETIKKIGRGKESFLAICFPMGEKDQVVVGKTMTYKVITDGVEFSEPIKEGWFEIRISAQVNNRPLPLLKIGVKLEMENDISKIKEVRKITERNILFWKVKNH